MGSYTIERFGSVHPRVQLNCGLGNTIPGHELEWISVNGLLVASRPIKFNISWDRLNKEGLVYGKEIVIDGKPYICRLVKNYPGANGDWEWHDILSMTSSDDDLWHWKRCWSWSQDMGKEPMTDGYCGVFGYSCAFGEGWMAPSTKSKQIGWRPLLEPISARPNDIQAMFGSMITVTHNGSVVIGMLAGISDYDLVLRQARFRRMGLDSDDFAKIIKDGTIVVNRALVDYISQVQNSEN